MNPNLFVFKDNHTMPCVVAHAANTNDINRISSKSTKILLVLYSCEYLFKIYTTYQSTYFIDYFNLGVIKNTKIKQIHQVQKKLYTKQV